MASALSEAGAKVVVCARNSDRCEEAAATLRDHGASALGLGCDVRRIADIQAVVDAAVEWAGSVDILVNNAGTTWGAAPEEVPAAGWNKVIDVNLTGSFLFSQAVGRHLIAAGSGGAIVNISSIAASRGMESSTMDAIAYNASKGGVVALTFDLAVKWARHNIRVNAIAPGWFPTDLAAPVLDSAGSQLVERVPLRRLGGPDDLKGAVVFLASAAAGYVTGHVLTVDGGQTAAV
jgi:NAD(P)-dependent dehydrogenase (short-subunit alcohol dehydrogenase family)